MQSIDDFQALLSTVSHEVRNPVTLINSYLQLMSQNHPEICDFAYWHTIQSEMEHLRSLLDDLTAYQHVLRLHTTLTDIDQWLREYVDMLSPVFAQKPYITFTYQIEANLPQLSLDSSRLRQALDNLIRNSIEAIDCSCTSTYEKDYFLDLRADMRKGFFRIRIRDNGCGIKEEQADTIFDAFVTHKQTGTGLGLAIAKRVVQAHGGRIICASRTAPTEFQILLPTENRQ